MVRGCFAIAVSLCLFQYTVALPSAQHKNTEVAGQNFDQSHQASALDVKDRAVKPKPVPKPKPAPRPKPGAPSKPVPQPLPKPVFPQLNVPYQRTATDLCNLYLDCDEDGGDATADAQTARFVVRREGAILSKRRTVNAELTGGKLTLKAPDQPSSGALYKSPRDKNPKNVFDFENDKLGSTVVKNFKAIKKPTDQYATEHIIELQTIAMFLEYAEKKDSSLLSFFRTKWLAPLNPSDIKGRPHKPPYPIAKQDSLSLLVFEAMGSFKNPTHFVLCESQLNSYKERLWSRKQLMATADYDEAVAGAVDGSMPSSVFLSSLRLTFGVYSYMNAPDIVDTMRTINTNIRLELSNAGSLTKQPQVNLVPLWDAFLTQHFTDVETSAEAWLKARMPKAKTGVKDAIVKYQKLLRQLNQKQTGPGAATHAKTQKAKQTALEKELKAQTARRVQAEKDVVTLRGQRKNKTAAQKTAIDRQIRAAKKDLRAEIKKEGSAQRKMHELYAYSVQKIVLNLKEDQKILAGFERAISGLKLTRP